MNLNGWFYHLCLLMETARQDAPVIMSSWPRHGSTLLMSSNMAADGVPVILYFSQLAGGVSSYTVTVQCVFAKSQHLSWATRFCPMGIVVTLKDALRGDGEIFYILTKANPEHYILCTSGPVVGLYGLPK